MNFAIRVSVVALSACVLATGSVRSFAHHSAAQFDFTKPVTVEGTVKVFEVINPHTRATVTIDDKKGGHDVTFEGHSASNFYRAGYTRGAVKFGEHIRLLIAPRKDGGDGGFILSFKTQSGLTVGFAGYTVAAGEPPPK